MQTKSRISALEPPTLEQLQAELARETRCRRRRAALLILGAALALLLLAATLLTPVLRIYGSSMAPGLNNGDVVAALRSESYEPGEVIAFYYNNNILVKRVIAQSGDWVDISEDGAVTVNGIALDEPYLNEKALGECDITLPYQVPEGRLFVMGDHRAVSVDSRSADVGCVAGEEIVGRIVFRLWPLSGLGPVS